MVYLHLWVSFLQRKLESRHKSVMRQLFVAYKLFYVHLLIFPRNKYLVSTYSVFKDVVVSQTVQLAAFVKVVFLQRAV